jgi:hypothetical protein
VKEEGMEREILALLGIMFKATFQIKSFSLSFRFRCHMAFQVELGRRELAKLGKMHVFRIS